MTCGVGDKGAAGKITCERGRASTPLLLPKAARIAPSSSCFYRIARMPSPVRPKCLKNRADREGKHKSRIRPRRRHSAPQRGDIIERGMSVAWYRRLETPQAKPPSQSRARVLISARQQLNTSLFAQLAAQITSRNEKKKRREHSLTHLAKYHPCSSGCIAKQSCAKTRALKRTATRARALEHHAASSTALKRQISPLCTTLRAAASAGTSAKSRSAAAL